jgi:hypothetical protein
LSRRKERRKLKYTLLDNGADSLKSAFENIEAFDEVVEGGYHRLKDAVIFLNHGVEILLKLILKKHSPSLMFENIDAYLKAKEGLKKKPKAKNVFEINKNLKTVTLLEALKRVEYLCDIEIPENFRASIMYINDIRNRIMHYEIELDDDEREKLVKALKYCYEEAVNFFESHIEDLESKIRLSRFELTYEEYRAEQAEIQAEMYYEALKEKEEGYIDWLEGAYEDLGEGKW